MLGSLRILRSLRRRFRRDDVPRRLSALLGRSRACQGTRHCRTSGCAKFSTKRVLTLESGGSAFFLVIDGAQDYLDAGKEDGDISGIVLPRTSHVA